MNCMTYDYRFSMLIHTEFEYRSRYLKKTSAIPDIHYETPLNSDICAVLEQEANFNSEMKPALDETYFWKKLNEYNDDENIDPVTLFALLFDLICVHSCCPPKVVVFADIRALFRILQPLRRKARSHL